MVLRGPGAGESVTAPLGSPVAQLSATVKVKKWFTTLRTVYTLFFGTTGSTEVQNEELTLIRNSANHLQNSNIQVDSERVKKRNTLIPPDTITFTAFNTWYSLTNSDIVKGSVKVFDSNESTILFTEGIDCLIDYKNGRIKRIQSRGTPGSASSTGAGSGSSVGQFACSIAVRQIVNIHYDYYSDYVKNTDYVVNYTEGNISRLSEGSISDGERVYVDYRTSSSIDEEIITEAINQAHTFVMNRIDSSLEGMENENLKHAETYFSLAILAASSASDMLDSRRSDDVDTAARAMMELSDRHEERGWRYLSPYLEVTSPRLRGGRLRKNVAWGN